MKVFALVTRNHDGYYDYEHDCEGVYAAREQAVAAIEADGGIYDAWLGEWVKLLDNGMQKVYTLVQTTLTQG